MIKGQTVAIDATTLEANAALRHTVRRDTGESDPAFLTALAQTSGIETPTRADLARLDRKRKKKGSNKDWTSLADPDAKITKMKDGRTHLAHKAEHAVDLDTGAIVAVTIQGADEGDTHTLPETLAEAVEQLDHVTDADGEPGALAPEARNVRRAVAARDGRSCVETVRASKSRAVCERSPCDRSPRASVTQFTPSVQSSPLTKTFRNTSLDLTQSY